MDYLPLDILKIIFNYLHWADILICFKLTKRLHKLNTDQFWIDKIKSNFTDLYFPHTKHGNEFCHYLAFINIDLLEDIKKYKKSQSYFAFKGLTIRNEEQYNEYMNKLKLLTLESDKISTILVNNLKRRNKYNIYYIDCKISFSIVEFLCFNLKAKKDDLIVYVKDSKFKQIGFFKENNEVKIKNIVNLIYFPQSFLRFLFSLSLPLSIIGQLYEDIPIFGMDSRISIKRLNFDYIKCNWKVIMSDDTDENICV